MTDPKPRPQRVDLSDEKVHWDLGTSQSYAEYLQLDKLLDAQKPNSFEHDEMMFIIVHQASELWMRLFRHELDSVFEFVRRDNLDPSFKRLSRISQVQNQLLAVWEVLSSMTPYDYSAFRNSLGEGAYVLDEDGRFRDRCNTELVGFDPIEAGDAETIRALVAEHRERTGSAVAGRLLADWEASLTRFVKVMPQDYKRVLDAARTAEERGLTVEEAIMAASRV